MRVAQENLCMLKRLNEKTSFYNVDKLNRDYEMSQYYKKNHCLYSPIDFTKANKFLSGSIIKLTKKKFFNKTHYASAGKLEYVPPPITSYMPKSNRRKKKFEDFNYRDLNLGVKQKSEIFDYREKQFKKISEIDTEEKKENEEQENNELDNNNENKEADKNEENKDEKKKEDDGDGGIKEQKQNKRDEKEENGEKNKENN